MDPRMALASLFLVVLALQAADADRIPDVCNEVTTTSAIPRPQVQDLFHVKVECKFEEQNRTVFVVESFDYRKNAGRLHQSDLNTVGDVIFDYNDNEILMIDYQTSLCEVGVLSSDQNRWLFGYRAKANEEPHVFGASGALHFGNSPEMYMGTAKVRGIAANRWYSCQYSDILDATMEVNWYFSSKSNWDMQLGTGELPLRATAVGKMYKQGSIVSFSHTYDLYEFRSDIRDDEFEIPEGVYCPGRIKTKRFQALPDKFAFNLEVFDNDNDIVTTMKESYNSESKVNVFRYKSAQENGFLKDSNRELQVNDYNTGVSYVIDTITDSCQIYTLGSYGVHFLKIVDTSGHVQMMSPSEFLHAGLVDYVYAGVRTARGIQCDVWVGRTDKIQGYTDRNLTVEWYFAVTSIGERWKLLQSDWRLPIRFKLWDQERLSAIKELNIYAFDVTVPDLISVDISPCFHGVNRRRFTFDIDGINRDAVKSNLVMFKYTVNRAVSLSAGISALRVADIQVFDDVSVLHISFDLLDRPNIGGDVYDSGKQNDLTTAVNQYNSIISTGRLVLDLQVGSNQKSITPLPGTAAEIGAGTSGYTTGALAGLGVGMLAVGSMGGAGATFFFFK